MHVVMRAAVAAIATFLGAATGTTAAMAQTTQEAMTWPNGGCPSASGALGVARIVEIDAASGPLYGDITKYGKEDTFLGPKEVVLTFDDGPLPWITKSILDTLDRHCAKATFFSVGKMALAYPASVKDVLARGHTLGGHTHTHPLNIARLKPERAVDEIERGFAAIALAAGEPIAPFFRFPGLSDNPTLLAHLQSRGIATFTVDVVSNDSYIGDPSRLARLTLDRIEARQGGIVLFHDIKAATAKALPQILAELKSRGYKVVHLQSKSPLVPVAEYASTLTPLMAKSEARTEGKPTLVPFYGTTGPQKTGAIAGEPATAQASVSGAATGATPAAARAVVVAAGRGPDAAAQIQVTVLAPPPRQRIASASPDPDRKPPARANRRLPSSNASATPHIGGWSTRVKPTLRNRIDE